MKLKELVGFLENMVPLSMQESYDNCGLIVGDKNQEITGVLVALDCIESIVDEAIQKKCNVIVAHHPIVFKGLKSLVGKNYIERTVLKSIKNDIAIYAIHTNLDNYRWGVNFEIGNRIGLKNLQILAPKDHVLQKLAFFVPNDQLSEVRNALFELGAGGIGNYDQCSFNSEGEGTFRALKGANPFVGKQGELHREKETRVEIIVSSHQINVVVNKLCEVHPYEEVAYDIYPLANVNFHEGAGMVGELPEAMDEKAFLEKIKTTFKCGVIRHTALRNKKIQKVAFCGGSGIFLLPFAKRAKADIYITADVKYHEFFDAENDILLADIGHYESEQFTIDLLCDILIKKFTTFAVHLTKMNTNPINYL